MASTAPHTRSMQILSCMMPVYISVPFPLHISWHTAQLCTAAYNENPYSAYFLQLKFRISLLYGTLHYLSTAIYAHSNMPHAFQQPYPASSTLPFFISRMLSCFIRAFLYRILQSPITPRLYRLSIFSFTQIFFFFINYHCIPAYTDR